VGRKTSVDDDVDARGSVVFFRSVEAVAVKLHVV
jgi:hypothetical protein